MRLKEYEVLSRVMMRGYSNVTPRDSVVSVVSLGKSIRHSISPCSLRMINSLESSPLLNRNVIQPRKRDVNSGRSVHHSLSVEITLKHCTRTFTECTASKQNILHTGQVYSSHHSLTITLHYQGSVTKAVITSFTQSSHFNHSQRRKILNLTHGVISEGIATNLQFSQSLTILHIESTM